jgi:hypothetical protein
MVKIETLLLRYCPAQVFHHCLTPFVEIFLNIIVKPGSMNLNNLLGECDYLIVCTGQKGGMYNPFF